MIINISTKRHAPTSVMIRLILKSVKAGRVPSDALGLFAEPYMSQKPITTSADNRKEKIFSEENGTNVSNNTPTVNSMVATRNRFEPQKLCISATKPPGAGYGELAGYGC
jgi:hypothetical protein